MRFAYTRPDGGVSIVEAGKNATREQVIARAIPADATDVVELPDDWLPPDADRTFRNAWGHISGVFHVDISKARNIWRDKMRQVRAPKLAALDVEYQRALEANNIVQQQTIAAQKQSLRDVTENPAIDAASTPDELRKVWPKEL